MHTPRIRNIVTSSGYIEFEAIPSWYQIEVYSYTRHKVGSHVKNSGFVYTDHIGKRYHLRCRLKRGVNSWTVPESFFRHNKHNYFKFSLRDSISGELSELGGVTVKTVKMVEWEQVGSRVYMVH